jgi:hypothetical protein
MNKYLLILASLAAGISCITHGMDRPQTNQPPSKKRRIYLENNPYAYTNQFHLPNKEQERKLFLENTLLELEQAKICTKILKQTNPNEPATKIMRQNVIFFLQAWSGNLHVHGYPINEWNQGFPFFPENHK